MTRKDDWIKDGYDADPLMALCPFCGYWRVGVIEIQHIITGDHGKALQCLRCSAIGPVELDEKSAKLSWHHRVNSTK